MVSDNVIQQTMDVYKALIVPGLTAKNILNQGNAGGDVNTELNLSFLGDGSSSGYENMTQVRDVLSALTISAKLDADVEAVNMTPLAMFAYSPPASDFLINDGVTFSADLAYQDLLFYANGETYDIIERFGLAEMLEQPLNFADRF